MWTNTWPDWSDPSKRWESPIGSFGSSFRITGKGLFNHDLLGHAGFTFEDQLRVLWLMKGPGIPQGRSIAEPALLTDVAPTLLQHLNLERPGADGVSFALCLEAGPRLSPSGELVVVRPLSRKERPHIDGWLSVAL